MPAKYDQTLPAGCSNLTFCEAIKVIENVDYWFSFAICGTSYGGATRLETVGKRLRGTRGLSFGGYTTGTVSKNRNGIKGKPPNPVIIRYFTENTKGK